MRSSYPKSWRPAARGLTLVEVLAALAILGGLLAGVLVARAQLVAQAHRAGLVQLACQQAEGLLASWHAPGQKVPIGQEGWLDEAKSFRWRTQEQPSSTLRPYGGRVVRFTVSPARVARVNERPLISVDLVVDDTAAPTTRPDAG